MPPHSTPVGFRPPANWSALYSATKKYTAELVPKSEFNDYYRIFDTNVSAEERRFRHLVGLMLSAQTRAAANLKAMENLLQKGNLTPQRIRDMPLEELRECIRCCCYYNTKAKRLKQTSAILLRDHAGKVPHSFEEVIALPGVGPKMAHLFVQEADDRVVGIGVDTHVHRIAQRFGWVPPTVRTPEDTRKALEAWLPKKHWKEVNLMLVGLGQKVCRPVHPRCAECKLNGLCPNAFKEDERLRQIKARAAPRVKRQAKATRSQQNQAEHQKA